MREWHEAQTGLARCSSMAWRSEAVVPTFEASRLGTFGGGGGGGALRKLSRTHLPRRTTEVRVTYEETVRTLPCVNTPPRLVPVRSTFRNSVPFTPGMP